MNATLTIKTFGKPKLELNQKPLKGLVSQKKSEALMVYLAANSNKHSRQNLATLFWGDYPEDRALNNLSVLLSNLRKQLTEHLIIDRQTVSLNPAAKIWVDNHAFSQSTPLLNKTNLNQEELELLNKNINSYQGQFLEGFFIPNATDFETWMLIERERFNNITIRTLNILLKEQQAKANYPEGIKLARKTLTLDPLNEQSNYQLIYMLALNKQPTEALNHYKHYEKQLKQELELEPEPETQALMQSIKKGEFSKQQAKPQVTPPAEPKKATPKLNTNELLNKLEPLTSQQLVGIGRITAHLSQALNKPTKPYLVAIYGMGGLGKTTLANKLMREFINQETPNHFTNYAWVSAKQEEFLIADGISQTGRPALDKEKLIANLFEQLKPNAAQNQNSQEKQQQLSQDLKQSPQLIVIDNLETAIDINEIIPLLRELSNPTKFIITSRFALKNHTDIYSYNHNELSKEHSLELLKHEAQNQMNHPLQKANEQQLEQIYDTVGGNPLALKLIIGQLSFLPLNQVLNNLKEAKGKRIDALYTYMYWQAWNMLDEHGKQLFLAMPTVQNGTFTQLSIASMLDSDELQTALAKLITLSLVQVAGNLEETRYRLHRLTETFLMNEVLKWQMMS